MEIVSTRFYTLAEAEALVGISARDLIRIADTNQINLCVLVPSGYRAFAVDPDSTVTWDEKALLNRQVSRARPNKERGMPERKEDVVAFVLDWPQCEPLADYGLSRQVFFSTAYSVRELRTFGLVSPLLHIRPVRLPLYEKGGRTPADQSRWRFAMYPHGAQFTYLEGAGYPEPADLLITPDVIHVVGYELQRLPRLIDLPSSVDDEDGSEIDEADIVEGNVPSSDQAVPEAVSISEPLTEQPYLLSGRPVGSEGSASAPSEAERPRGPEVILESRGPVVFLKLNEVLRRIGKGRTWLTERTTQGHPNFDPSVPQPIKIGRSVLWIEKEVEEWKLRQVRNNRSG